MNSVKQAAKKEMKGTPMSEMLGHLMADTYTLYLKTQNFHWNVTGPSFYSPHAL